MSENTISVYLPGSTKYVTGTVNGVTAIWTNTEPNVWQAIAAKAVDGLYAVRLILVSESGMTNEIGLTIFDALSLITDRTAEDVRRWKELKSKGYANLAEAEKAEWAHCKGAYNNTDLNRVESAVMMISEKLNELHINVDVTTKSDWEIADLPTVSDLNRYLGNVVKLRNASSGLREAPKPPDSMVRLDYIGANRIEETLLYINTWADRTKDSQKYSGEFYGGEL